MKKLFSIILIAFFSLGLAFGFNIAFLNLLERPAKDQALLLFFLTCSFAFIFHKLFIEGVNWKVHANFKIEITSQTIRENIIGILLAILFFGVYLFFSLQFLPIAEVQVDNLFDADTSSWMRRISSPDVKDFQMRGPHPFTYFIFRPFGLFLNLFTKDPPLSAVLLNTLVGALCIFLVWIFFRRQFRNKIYAALVASLLGISASHLFLSSVVETYIFSAFA